MHDPVLLAKAETVERCILRARGALAASADFFTDLDAQDIALINIIRACEASIDIALRMVKLANLGLPNTSSDSFNLLAQHKIIDTNLSKKLTRMVSFRNIAVHQYTKLDYEIVIAVIRHELDDVLRFIGTAITRDTPQNLKHPDGYP